MITKCAEAWSSSVHMIYQQSKRQFLRELLAGLPLSYDDAHFYFSCVDQKGPDEKFDLLIRLAHAISVDASLSLSDVTYLTKLVANFAVEFIAFNISEVTEITNHSAAVIAAEQAYQTMTSQSRTV
jgi:hypothetical protein